ncbi:hypothetical protein LSTR_LSTR000784 [Laodelphax striatellus]|uniref:Uncharacterized protein n=1 Tax=Laodelphax striatellus TaxID=195883 RepID=A0A482XGH0_LAOST|nr:hypothetical protein LSTR_LSTR000784 [Laodelphax striatellus]
MERAQTSRVGGGNAHMSAEHIKMVSSPSDLRRHKSFASRPTHNQSTSNMKAVAAFVLLVVALFAVAQAAEQKETLKGESTAYYGAYPYAAYPYAYSAYPHLTAYRAYPYSAYPYSAYPYYYR